MVLRRAALVAGSADLGAWLIAWQMSLQHELIHGHPTRSRRINAALGFPPLWLWLPFACYQESHLAHHAGDGLTDPRRDPESFYVTGEEWSRMGPVRRMLTHANNTFVGRVLIGPALSIGGFIAAEARLLVTGRSWPLADLGGAWRGCRGGAGLDLGDLRNSALGLWIAVRLSGPRVWR